jgi:hypothetical protein
MRSLYTRPQRASINHPATIGDIPQEVLQKAFLPLGRVDLISASSACRGWRPVAQEIIHSRVKIKHNQRAERLNVWICGARLNSLVFGTSSFSQISTLYLVVEMIRDELIPLIAQIVSPTLSSLEIYFEFEDGVSYCFEILYFFFSRCRWLRKLLLECFGVGNDPAAVSQIFKDGFGRLKQLELIECYDCGDVRLFFESIPIPNLKFFRYFTAETARDEEIEVVNAAVINFGASLVRLNLECLVSSANLIKIADSCPSLVELSIKLTLEGEKLSLSAIKAIASLPLLNRLKIG